MHISKCMECGLINTNNFFICSKDDVIPNYFMCPCCFSRNVQLVSELDTIPKDGVYLFEEHYRFPNGWIALILNGTNYVWFIERENPDEPITSYTMVKSSYLAFVGAGVSSSMVNLWSLKGDHPIKLSSHLNLVLAVLKRTFAEKDKFPNELIPTKSMRGLRNNLVDSAVRKNVEDTLGSGLSLGHRIHIG